MFGPDTTAGDVEVHVLADGGVYRFDAIEFDDRGGIDGYHLVDDGTNTRRIPVNHIPPHKVDGVNVHHDLDDDIEWAGVRAGDGVYSDDEFDDLFAGEGGGGLFDQ